MSANFSKPVMPRAINPLLADAATIERLCDKFGEALSVVVNILDPDVVVLGGGFVRCLKPQGDLP